MKTLRSFLAAFFLIAALCTAQPLTGTLSITAAPLTITPQDGCDKLVGYLAANLPVAPKVIVPAFNPNDSGAYIKALNLKHAIEEVYGGDGPAPMRGVNQIAFDQYKYSCHEWEQHRDTSVMPAWPATLQYVSVSDFDQWWAMYNLRFDQNSAFFGDDEYTGVIARKQFFKRAAPALPAVIIVQQAPPAALPTSGNPIGEHIPGSPFYKVAASGFFPGDPDPTGAYILINPSPMNADPTKFVWVRK